MNSYMVNFEAAPVIDDSPPQALQMIVDARDRENAAAAAQFLMGDGYQLEITSIVELRRGQ